MSENDIVGRIFGTIKVLEYSPEYTEKKRINNPSHRKTQFYKCECINCHNLSYRTKSQLKAAEKRGGTGCQVCNKPDLTGEKIGRLYVIGPSDPPNNNCKKAQYWLCQCECGNQKILPTGDLQGESHTQSCGCLATEIRKERMRARATKHGDSMNDELSGILRRWENMHKRCNNPNDSHYHSYGGRGIKICDEWYDYDNFREWALKNGYDKNLTLEREDVNGDYEPSNCSWIPMADQARNKQNTFYVTYNNETKTVLEWSEITGIPYKTLWARLKAPKTNYTLEEAMTLPVGTPPQALKDKWKVYYNRGSTQKQIK